MTKDTCSPAFPTSLDKGYPTEIVGGLTMRDEFAAKALQGICASGPSVGFSNLQIAAEAYALADAMLDARE